MTATRHRETASPRAGAAGPPAPDPRYAASLALFERARAVVPGGIYGHVTPALVVPGASPYFAARARGCRYEDVDGNCFIDLLCGYGPVVLGHAHPAVEAAAERQRALGDCFNHPTERMVELAERLTSLIAGAEWAVFGKNGSDVTTWAVQVAREHTTRRKLLLAEGAYHGVDPWCTPGQGGLIDEDTAHVVRFRYNDPQSLEDAGRRHGNDLAALVLTPFDHPLYEPSRLPTRDFVAAANAVRERHGALLVLDDVRAGFRLSMNGSHALYGFDADLACYSKALANGHALSACVGAAQLRRAAERVFITGSFFNSAVAMAASLATLDALEAGAFAHLQVMGARLVAGLRAAGAASGRRVSVTGPDTMPLLTFDDDPDLYSAREFARRCIAGGLFVHPFHNWFVSAAHEPQDIDEALAIARAALAGMRGAPGPSQDPHHD